MRSLLASEDGIALVMALGATIVLIALGTSVAYYTTANQTSANTEKSKSSAYQVAEAGINAAFSRLTFLLDSTGAPKNPALTPALSSALPDGSGTPANVGTVAFPNLGGTATYWGSLNQSDPQLFVWTITSVGRVTNAGKTSSVKLTRTVNVEAPQTDPKEWSRFYQDSTASCLTIDTVTITSSVATKGNLCLVNNASITGAASTVDAGGNVTIAGTLSNSGTARYPTAASGWTNPTNVYTNNNSYASTTVAGNTTSATLAASGFGFSIPAGASIAGVVVEVGVNASSSNRIVDGSVYLQKTSQVGTNHANGAYWSNFGTRNRTYGGQTDSWGASLTPADVNASTFGVRVTARNASSSSTTASIDYVRVTIYYYASTTGGGIGTSSVPVLQANIGSTCQLNANPAHLPCSAADHVWAGTINTTAAADNANLQMPQVDFPYWFQNASPGPKHPCTNSSPNMGQLVFDNNNSATSDNSVHYDNSADDMTPDYDYTCTTPQGKLIWNHTTRVLQISGTIFFDGDVRFDSDGQVVHYQGRGIIFAAGNVEFDEMVCAGGSGTSSCYPNMSNWDPNQNYMVIYSAGDSEYDQGGTNCPASTYGQLCPSGYQHPVSGFQGVVSADGTCTIHEKFQLSGPVICNQISLPYESDGWPTYYTYPVPNALINAQDYASVASALRLTLTPGAQSGG